ncbi:MAG TPA: efflux RND transporter periplasmic adaptor subunit [Gemmataceae bacterium]|nr:efflux RND transporter periplasmic adaptor subunit [Gemmataceae bacterium]
MRWKWAAAGGAALAVLAGIAVGAYWLLRPPPGVMKLPGVVEIQEVRLGSRVGGRVAEVKAVEGDLAEAGQPLVVLDVPELKAQAEQLQARLAQAEAELDKARNGARKEEKEAAWAAVESAFARWNRLEAGPRPEEIDQARADLKAAETDLKWAREDFDRAEQVYRRSAGSRADYDAARANLNRSQAKADAARARLELLLAGSRPEDIYEARAELERAFANYDLLLAGTRYEDVELAEARVAEARGKLREVEANLAEAVVRAPERVVVEVLAVRKGDLVMPNQPVVRVLRAEDMWVKVYVPETELGKLRLGQDVEVTVDAYPGRRFQGKVIQIASESEFTPRNVQSLDERRHQMFGVKVRVDDPQGVFKSGMAADVWLPLHD